MVASGREVAAKYKAGNHGPIILIGHSLGADAVMLMGDVSAPRACRWRSSFRSMATNRLPRSGNVARVMNITQRDYAYMKRGYGFRGELANVDVSNDESIGHISIDKTPRLHTMVVNKIAAVVGKGGQSRGARDQCLIETRVGPGTSLPAKTGAELLRKARAAAHPARSA